MVVSKYAFWVHHQRHSNEQSVVQDSQNRYQLRTKIKKCCSPCIFFFSHIKSKYYGINEELVHQTFRKLLKPVNVVYGQNPYKEIIRNCFL